MIEELLERLRAAGDGEEYETLTALLEEAADQIEKQHELLQSMNDFIGQYRDEFEEGLSYEEQEKFREYFELSASPRDPFGEIREMTGNDDEDEDGFGFGSRD